MKRKLKISIIIVIILIIIAFAVAKVFDVPYRIYQRIYKTEYSEYVYKYAQEYNVDPLMIFAIIKAESNFNPNVLSNRGAIGLMQLMDGTAEELCNKMGIYYTKQASLYDPELNVRIGTKYFSELINEYDGNNVLALTAYNAGKGNVNKWIEAGTIKEDGSDIENIPYKETNNYVRKILRDYEIYKNLCN